MNFQTPGYEHLELSTQLVIAEAFKRNLKVEVLDESEQFIRISNQTKTEYIKEATKTSLDSYVTSLVLENKKVQKQVLDENKIRVPHGKSYFNKDQALQDYEQFKTGKWVVKPKTTNFGLGITLLKENPSQADYKKAIERAFAEAPGILVEEFIEGIECRFLVLGDECLAVLHRVPANVMGDGKHSIEELVKLKNQDERRGKGYKTPLEYIQITEVEKDILKEQGLNPQSVPQKDEQVFLRKNSNISTGGDSIDYTDRVHPDYKAIAVKASQAVNAKVCGVDVMLSDPSSAPSTNNHAIIELNFNPVLYFHDYPYEGENRQTAIALLDLLGF